MNRDNILELAEILGSKVSRPNGANILLKCPYFELHENKGKGSPTLSVSVNDLGQSLGHCFNCNRGGTLLKLFKGAHKDRIDNFATALAFIAENDAVSFYNAMESIELDRNSDKIIKIKSDQNDDINLQAYIRKCQKFVPVFLTKRGFGKHDFDKWGIGFDEQQMRAIFPVKNELGHLVGATGRTILPDNIDPPKYKDFPIDFARTKTKYFYGENFIDTSLNIVYLTEGPTSTICAARVLPNVVGVFGASTGITEERLAKLKKWTSNITILFDGDEAGKNAVHGKYNKSTGTWKPGIKETLSQFFVVKVGLFATGNDPGSVTPAVLRNVVNEAVYL